MSQLMAHAQTSSQTPEPQFQVVINHEGQYSLWPLDREVPAGWSEAGCSGGKEECLTFVDAQWTDMRPASLRVAATTGAA